MIGYYAHHQGVGHRTRMQNIAAALEEPVWGLGSALPPPGWSGPWTQLARDDDPAPTSTAVDDLTAHGVLHWVPPHHPGLAARMAQVAEWAARERPRALVVDVSVEVSLLARLCGIPVVVVAMPGRREDTAHRIAYDVADALLAPWPRGAHDLWWPDRWTDKAWFVGGISRFDDRVPTPTRSSPDPTVLLLWGAGGRTTTPAHVQAAKDATPEWTWVERSPSDNGSDDLWQELMAADVVVSHAGQNTVAEIAAARRPAVVVAQPRPFGEQEATARRLEDWRVAVGRSEWPPGDEWPELLRLAQSRGGHGWARWSDGAGARLAAQRLTSLAAVEAAP